MVGNDKVLSEMQELLADLCNNQTPIFINGYGVGKLISVYTDYVGFEIIREEEKDKKKKNKETGKMDNYKEKTIFKEMTYIPTVKIDIISKGEKEVPKSVEENKIDEDLGGL